MTALTRTIAIVSILAGLALVVQVNPWKIALVLLSCMLFGMMLSCVWAAVIFYNWYNDKEE